LKKDLFKSTTLPTDIKVEDDSLAVEDVEDENLYQQEHQEDDDYHGPYRYYKGFNKFCNKCF